MAENQDDKPGTLNSPAEGQRFDAATPPTDFIRMSLDEIRTVYQEHGGLQKEAQIKNRRWKQLDEVKTQLAEESREKAVLELRVEHLTEELEDRKQHYEKARIKTALHGVASTLLFGAGTSIVAAEWVLRHDIRDVTALGPCLILAGLVFCVFMWLKP